MVYSCGVCGRGSILLWIVGEQTEKFCHICVCANFLRLYIFMFDINLDLHLGILINSWN